ncbi:MAG: NADH-quinone oxidoreductase subunit NuoN [Candidatus Gastranaerophilales bacterium]|nr:NADH-quinone oxidoreductase subunit NuoN [Candidatus Gastranaerophilales bacterium]
MNWFFDIVNFLLPEMIVIATILLSVVLTFLLKEKGQKSIYLICLTGVLFSIVSFAFIPAQPYVALLGSFLSADFTVFFRALIALGTLFVLFMSKRYTWNYGIWRGEFFILLLTATLGAMLLVAASDFIMLFVAIETLSLSSYALCGYTKNDRLSNEAAMKYLVVGASSSAIMLFGVSYLYGIFGETNILKIMEMLLGYEPNFTLVFALLLMLGGFLYKISAVPFHMWTPDVYEGAPIPVAAYLSVVSKIAGFAILIRLIPLFVTTAMLWSFIIAIIAVITMSVGNLVAIVQKNVKRLMAYSSIAHAGYMLLGLALFTKLGVSGVVFYLITYLFMNIGAWAGIEIFINQSGKAQIEDFKGLAYSQPYLALGLTVCLISLAGIPLTAGFLGKFYLFQTIAFSGVWGFVFLFFALINTVVAMYYYLKIVRQMFKQVAPVLRLDVVPKSISLNTILAFSAFCVVFIGIFSSPIIQLAQQISLNGAGLGILN